MFISGGEDGAMERMCNKRKSNEVRLKQFAYMKKRKNCKEEALMQVMIVPVM